MIIAFRFYYQGAVTFTITELYAEYRSIDSVRKMLVSY